MSPDRKADGNDGHCEQEEFGDGQRFDHFDVSARDGRLTRRHSRNSSHAAGVIISLRYRDNLMVR